MVARFCEEKLFSILQTHIYMQVDKLYIPALKGSFIYQQEKCLQTVVRNQIKGTPPFLHVQCMRRWQSTL